MKHKVLAVIPARGGSKGLPKKNIKMLHGIPLIGWTIKAANNSQCITKTIVSTDSDEIASVAIAEGSEVPFIRPAELSTDGATSMSVIKHAVDFFHDKGEFYDYVMMLQPTSPLRNHADIDKAMEQYLDHCKDEDTALISGYSISSKYNWILKIDNDRVAFVNTEVYKNLSRNELPPLFLPNGAIFIANTKELGSSFYHADTLIYEMPYERSVDIDFLEDFEKAEQYLSQNNSDLKNYD